MEQEHPAVGKRPFGVVSAQAGGLEPVNAPEVNSMLWFDNGDSDIFKA